MAGIRNHIDELEQIMPTRDVARITNHQYIRHIV